MSLRMDLIDEVYSTLCNGSECSMQQNLNKNTALTDQEIDAVKHRILQDRPGAPINPSPYR